MTGFSPRAGAGLINVSRRALLRGVTGLGIGHLATRHLGINAFAAAALPGDEASLRTETVRYASGDVQIEAYLAAPKTAGKYPAILLIHDAAGLNDVIRAVARRFAAEGFPVLAPDLLSRQGGMAKVESGDALNAIKKLSVDESIQDLRKGFAFLKENPAVVGQSISSVGFGWGGWRNFLLAGAVDGLQGAVMFSAATPSDGLSDVETPVLAHYGQFDFRIAGNALWTAKTMKDLGKKFSYYVYPGVSHGFFDSASAEYDAAAAQLAWTRTLEFLRRPS